MMQVLKINKRDEVLTLSSGGCNSLNLLLHGAGHVVSVDCNPAQSALLELKATAIRSVPPAASVQAPDFTVVCPELAPSCCLVYLIDVQVLYYIGLRLPHILSNFSSTSKAYQLSAAASHNSQMALPWCIGLGEQCIWPTFALSLLPVATLHHQVTYDQAEQSFSTSIGTAKSNVSTSSPLLCMTQRRVRCTGS